MGAALSAMDRVAAAVRPSAFAFRDTDRRCSSAQQSVQWFPPAARVPAASSAAAAALRQLEAELLYVCAVDGPALLVDAAAHAHGARMVMTLSTSGSSGVRIPAGLILTATGRGRAAGALAALGDGLFS